MHSASARFAYARFKSCGPLALETPRGILSLAKAVPAPPHAREAEARRTRGMCMRPSSARVKRRALPNEEECEREHLDRRGAGISHQQSASATRVLAGIPLGELCNWNYIDVR